jgi:hypothetical protein
MLKQTESLINKTHGTLSEQSAIDIFQNKNNCKLDISQKYYKSLVIESNGINWFIGGKLDAIHDDYIVEVKNRTKGFFSYVRDYENTQIQLYLLLTDHKYAKLVEKFRESIKVTDIERDQYYIDKIFTCLKIFIKNMELFINNKSLKMEYLFITNEDDKQKFLNKLYISEVVTKWHEEENNQENNNQENLICLIDDLD